MYFFHNTDEENAHMSNWYHVSFTVDGITYSSSEQYMMYQKALLFDDTETASKILDNDDPSTIKALGRMVAPFDEKYGLNIAMISSIKVYLPSFIKMKILGLCL